MDIYVLYLLVIWVGGLILRHFVNEISLSLLLLMNWFDGFTCLIRGKQKLINSPWFLNTRIQFSVLTKNCVFCRDMLCFRWLNIIKLSKRFRMRVYIGKQIHVALLYLSYVFCFLYRVTLWHTHNRGILSSKIMDQNIQYSMSQQEKLWQGRRPNYYFSLRRWTLDQWMGTSHVPSASIIIICRDQKTWI